MSNPIYIPKRAMFIVAHPDDIEFGSAGTAARWIKEGCVVSYVLCTSGDVGIAKEGMTKAEAARIREAEQDEAARVVGVSEVIYLRHPDGMLENTMALRKQLVREIRRFRPEAVVVMDPTLVWAGDGYINHPDHRAAGLAAIDAIFPAAGQPNLFEELAEEGLTAHKVRKVFSQNWSDDAKTNIYVNITEVIDLKIAALKAHKSQMGEWDPEPMVRQWSAEAGKGREMAYAERFRVVTLESDEDWEKRMNAEAEKASQA